VQRESILVVSCPTCGAKPGENCELNAGLSSTEPHLDRRLAALEGQQSASTQDLI
jgi:hypothetical protein